MSSKVLAGNETEVSNALSNIYKALGTEDVEMKQYFEFLEVIIKEGDVKDYFEKLSPEYKKLVEDVQDEMQQEGAFIEELSKYTVMAIQTHKDQENHLENIQLYVSNLGEYIHPEARKYFDFFYWNMLRERMQRN